jgi:2-polyprenyl-3-methyl-5-hydroxy-6-metoxy-1,4-benzoquinol methylase
MSEWFSRTELEKQSNETKGIKTLLDLNPKSDFGSYRLMNLTNDFVRSEIQTHNDITPSHRVNFMKSKLGTLVPARILDAGCGLGFTSNYVNKVWPKAEVVGVDISDDAIEFGEKYFTGVNFVKMSICSDSEVDLGLFDLIYAFEFYPFTRTADLK